MIGLCLDLNSDDERLTRTGEAVGPRDYIAPELEGGRAEGLSLPVAAIRLGNCCTTSWIAERYRVNATANRVTTFWGRARSLRFTLPMICWTGLS